VNPIVFVMRRPLAALVLVLVLAAGGVLSWQEWFGKDLPRSSDRVEEYTQYARTGARWIKERVLTLYGSYLRQETEHHEGERRKVVATSPNIQDVDVTQTYVCQIHSRKHIKVRAIDEGYLEEIAVREGQAVKKGDLMFKIIPILYEARYDAEKAEADLAELELKNTRQLFELKQAVVSPNEVLLFQAKAARAQAKAKLAKAELEFTNVKAPFDGIVDRLYEMQGSLIKEGAILTTLSDNSVMWVYFNVPERQYLEYMAARELHEKEDRIELKLANQEIFPEEGKIGAIEAQFNNENGNIAFRADFANPKGLLRHGQTGTILIHRTVRNALVIPQRATFELLDKRYVWVIGEDEAAHQRLITISHELDDIYVVASGLKASDRFVLEGVREVEEGGVRISPAGGVAQESEVSRGIEVALLGRSREPGRGPGAPWGRSFRAAPAG
jgi:membrane fusion protein (multidrug efflux system)